MRDLIFISHASPEDNEFVQWLGLQLTRDGYLIWSDITKLIGGEVFWGNIEEAIRKFSFKFVFVLSKASNAKQGTLDELHLARTVAKTNNLQDFIIPLRVDNLPFSEINVALHRINAINFQTGWWQGYLKLVEKLEKENAPKNTDKFNPLAVSSWWKSKNDGKRILLNNPENLASNWFPIRNIPENVFIHSFQGNKVNLTRGQENLPYSVFPIRDSIVSFANSNDLGISNVDTKIVSIEKILSGNLDSLILKPLEAKNSLIYLFRNSWLGFMKSLSLPLFNLSKRQCFYFTSNMFEKKLQSFEISEEISGRRSLVGKDKSRIWHFGISSDFQLEPILAQVISPHVLFSDDGTTIWQSASKLHRARRSACKDWWNPHWRCASKGCQVARPSGRIVWAQPNQTTRGSKWNITLKRQTK